MHLFGDGNGPHLAQFHARRERDSIELDWEVRNAPALPWRVLRSSGDFAATAGGLPGSDQTMVTEGSETHLRDDQAVEGKPHFHTLFARDGDGVWHQQVKTRLARRERLCWFHPAFDLAKGPLEGDADTYEQCGVPHGNVSMVTLLLLDEHPPMEF
jgi:hypothetical protein